MTALSERDLVSDQELVCAAVAGDRAAFAGIYDRYADRLYDFCIAMVRDRDTAADCVQDVFCTAAAQLSTLREPDRLRPWLYAVARQKALRRLRERRREHVSDDLPEAACAEPGPDTVAARTELAELIAAAAGGLSERDRAVLELTYRHGLDGPELAQALGVSHSNANNLVGRLRVGVERSLGALLVARRARTSPDGCTELGAVLDGWDGKLTVLMRKRIARHIQSCSGCQHQRSSLVNPIALLGAAPMFIPAPGWLRESTLNQIHLSPNAIPPTGSTADGHSAAAHAAPGRGPGQHGGAVRDHPVSPHTESAHGHTESAHAHTESAHAQAGTGSGQHGASPLRERVGGAHPEQRSNTGAHADQSPTTGSHADRNPITGAHADRNPITGAHADRLQPNGAGANLALTNPTGGRTRRPLFVGGLSAAGLIIALGIILLWPNPRTTPLTPAELISTAPTPSATKTEGTPNRPTPPAVIASTAVPPVTMSPSQGQPPTLSPTPSAPPSSSTPPRLRSSGPTSGTRPPPVPNIVSPPPTRPQVTLPVHPPRNPGSGSSGSASPGTNPGGSGSGGSGSGGSGSGGPPPPVP